MTFITAEECLDYSH